VTDNLSEGKSHERRLYLRASVRRASDFVLTGKPKVVLLSLCEAKTPRLRFN
jgi:hypothetical protein